jgi:hypothetical protein
MDGVAVKPLTIGFHETQFLGKLNQENQFAFWFQLSDEEREQAGSSWGPSNPQALNRYSYVQNNPLKYTDPTGHWTVAVNFGGAFFGAVGGRGGFSIAFDDQGNFAILGGGGGGLYSAVGAGSGLSVTVTNAPTVDKLAGFSVQIGGQVGEGPAINGELTFFTDGENIYVGGTLGGAVAFHGPWPGELHGTVEYDWLLAQGRYAPPRPRNGNSSGNRNTSSTTPPGTRQRGPQ